MQSLSEIAAKFVRRPGVYLYLNAGGDVIYVGKAKDLRARVSSYFRPSADLPPSKKVMLTEIARIETIIVRTETEAILLESTLIKKHRPKYNIILKDDKFFQYIRINLAEEFPSVSTVRRITLDGSRYFGPYSSGFAVRQTLKHLKRLFPYKSCPNPPDRPCFDAQLGRCLGHVFGPDSQVQYRRVIEQLMRFLEGHPGSVLRDLRQSMRRASLSRDYESAARFRDRLAALEHVLADQVVVTNSRQSYDVVGLRRRHNLAVVALLQVRTGKLVQRDTFQLQHSRDETDAQVIDAFVSQYYAQSTTHPREILSSEPVNPKIADAYQVRTTTPARGIKRKLVQIALENAQVALETTERELERSESFSKLALSELAHALRLPAPPHRIEMYDVSNIQGQHVVASMVVFEDGQPKKDAYRKFRIRNQAIPDDMHRLAEVLGRRFARHDETGWPIPDLLLLDGGKPQLGVVVRSIPGLAQTVRLAALAKENEELFIPGQKRSIRLPRDSAELRLVQAIRDEAHRFAIGYYRRTHRRESLRSMLDEIPGLGPRGKAKLLKEFGTYTAIRTAPDDELEKIVGSKAAARIRSQIN